MAGNAPSIEAVSGLDSFVPGFAGREKAPAADPATEPVDGQLYGAAQTGDEGLAARSADLANHFPVSGEAADGISRAEGDAGNQSGVNFGKAEAARGAGRRASRPATGTGNQGPDKKGRWDQLGSRKQGMVIGGGVVALFALAAALSGVGESNSSSEPTGDQATKVQTLTYDVVPSVLQGVESTTPGTQGETVKIIFDSRIPVRDAFGADSKTVKELGKGEKGELVGAPDYKGDILFTRDASELTSGTKNPDVLSKNVVVINLRQAMAVEAQVEKANPHDRAIQFVPLNGTTRHPIRLETEGDFRYADNDTRVATLAVYTAGQFATQQTIDGQAASSK